MQGKEGDADIKKRFWLSGRRRVVGWMKESTHDLFPSIMFIYFTILKLFNSVFNILPCIYRCLICIFLIWFAYDFIEKRGTWFFYFGILLFSAPLKWRFMNLIQLQNFTWYYCWWKPVGSSEKNEKHFQQLKIKRIGILISSWETCLLFLW